MGVIETVRDRGHAVGTRWPSRSLAGRQRLAFVREGAER
jgi:hypothetical protein